MSEFTVHSIPGSPFGRAVLATLEEKGADYRLSPVAPGTLRSPEHIARHPFGRVPVMEHDGFMLYETQAILRYLDRIIAAPALTPADSKAAALMDQAINVSDWYLFQGVGNVIGFQRVVGPKLMGLTPDEAAIEAAMPRAHMVFQELSRLLGDKPYFVGDSLSLADLHLAPHVEFLSHTPEWKVLGEAHPNLVAWLARMDARPSMQATTWDRVGQMAQAA
jgi:glutathione S-transferase